MIKLRKTYTRGVSLIEVVVAMGIFAVVVTLAVGGFVIIVRLQQKTAIMRETQQNARIMMEMIAKDARQAKIVSVPSGNTLNLTMPDDTTVVFYVYDGTENISRNTSVLNTNEVKIEKIGSTPIFSKSGMVLTISFKVKNKSGTTIYDEDETPLVTSVVLEGVAR